MFIKYIVCKVKIQNQASFSLAQEKWSLMSRAPGLICQFGGWDEKTSDTACILGLWSDRGSYENFMREIHDSITEVINQRGTYDHISVEFFTNQLDMPGKFKNIVDSLSEGKYLRIAECLVKSEKLNHFIEVQKNIWIPAMSRSQGMLGGFFSSNSQITLNNQINHNFLVVTLWDSKENHESYVEQNVATLRVSADVSEDLVSLNGKFIALKSEWMVVPQ